MVKYEILLNTLDKIRSQAPAEFTSYNPDPEDLDKVNSSRSKSFIHLFLKVRFGILDFKGRHAFITDGTQDGGIDAYYIDEEKKKLFLIQSKFRTTEQNFEEKSISSDDLIKMEVGRILKGEEVDSNGVVFNAKIKNFQMLWADLGDNARYTIQVIILGNLTRYNPEQIKRLIENTDYEIFDFKKTYDKLIFPICSGSYYDPNEIFITINLNNKEQSTLKQKVTTKFGVFGVRVIFVPTKEIGRILHKYKNSILKYNPRNFLSLSSNKVNKKIEESILNDETNDFALFNNGITMIADGIRQSEEMGRVDVGQIIIENPQIINGGQTAYTLSKIYEDNIDNPDLIFRDKEVLLKVVIIGNENELSVKFVEEVSNATNQQSRVEEADRRSNEIVQIEIQKNIFQEFGYFYEKKKGEFFNGTDRGYLDKDYIINRTDLIRTYLAFKGNPSDARRSGAETLFKIKKFKSILDNSNDYKKMFFGYLIFELLSEIEYRKKKNDWEDYDDFKSINFGSGLRYGKMSIISAVSIFNPDLDLNVEDIEELVEEKVKEVLEKWEEFENKVKEKGSNNKYVEEGVLDFDNYYKGSTINEDIKAFFKLDKEV